MMLDEAFVHLSRARVPMIDGTQNVRKRTLPRTPVRLETYIKKFDLMARLMPEVEDAIEWCVTWRSRGLFLLGLLRVYVNSTMKHYLQIGAWFSRNWLACQRGVRVPAGGSGGSRGCGAESAALEASSVIQSSEN